MAKAAQFVVCFSVLIGSSICFSQEWDKQDNQIPNSHVTTKERVDRGNWYIKKSISRKSREIIKQIEQALPAMRINRDRLLRDYEPIERDLKDLWASLEISSSNLSEHVQRRLQELNKAKEAKEDGALGLAEHKDDYEKLSIALKAVNDIGVSIADVREIVKKQAHECDAYDQKAWDNYERISDVLDDVRAERLYQEMVSFLDTINAVSSYFSKDLNGFMQSSQNSLQSYGQQIKELVNTLRDANLLEKPKKPEKEESKKPESKKQKEPVSEGKPWYIRWSLWIRKTLVWPLKAGADLFGRLFKKS